MGGRLLSKLMAALGVYLEQAIADAGQDGKKLGEDGSGGRVINYRSKQ